MIINALVKYYDILVADELYSQKIPLHGYSVAKISFVLNISLNGDLLNILDKQKIVDKRTILEEMIVPEQVKRQGQKPPPYFLSDKTEYVLGIDQERSTKALERFTSFKELHQRILKGVDDDGARAVLAFVENWNPEQAYEHPVLQPYMEAILKGANFVFRLDGQLGYIHERKAIKKAWEDFCENGEDEVIAQCMVSGETRPIERLHPNLKGILGGQPGGIPLVTVNCDAFESYGKIQSYNSPISKRVAFKYTTALNYMLNSSEQKIRLGDTTTVFWAESTEAVYNEIGFYLFSGTLGETEEEETPKQTKDSKTEEIIKTIFEWVQQGKKIDYDQLKIKAETQFYVLGLSPNAGRVSVRYFYRDSFGQFIDKMLQHYKDIRVVKREFEPEQLPLYRLVNELAPQVGKDKKIPARFVGNLMRSILSGAAYPTSVYQTLLMRVKADQDDVEKKIQKKITYPRVAMIKGYLLRYARIHDKPKLEEVLTVDLNRESTNVAYRLGRLFALLETAQQKAVGKDINATIKDRYFSSACASPRTVFPTLLRLAQHHIAKDEKFVWLQNSIKEVLEGVSTFPAHLNLEEQGLFILGYYHQHDFWKKTTN